MQKEQTGPEFVLCGNECERNKHWQSLYCMGTSAKGTNRGRVCIVWERVRKEQTGAEFALYGNECERNKHGQYPFIDSQDPRARAVGLRHAVLFQQHARTCSDLRMNGVHLDLGHLLVDSLRSQNLQTSPASRPALQKSWLVS